MENLKKLDKMIVVFLSVDDISPDLLYEVEFSLKGFQTAWKNRKPKIYTTQLEAVDPKYLQAGYDIKIISEGKVVLFSSLLEGNFYRDIKITHNWRKMLLSGVFDISCNWEHQSNGDLYLEGEDCYYLDKV